MRSPLHHWLSSPPHAHTLRVLTENDEERDIKLSANLRGRWKNAEEAILAARAVVVTKLDEDGGILTSKRLVEEQDDDAGSEDRAERYAEKLVAKERRELAMVLDRQGARIVQAFEAGADAANTSQEHLVNLCSMLTEHLGAAITNMHRVSAQLAQVLTGEEPKAAGESTSDALMKNVMQLVVAKAVSAGKEEHPPANGKGK